MLMRLSNVFTHFSTGRVTLLAVAIFILFMFFVLPSQAAQAEKVSGGLGSPDTSFFYEANDLYAFAESYGEAGRAAYIRARWTFDLIYPLVYAFFLITTISWAFNLTKPAGMRWQAVNLIPFAGMIFDYLENSATSLVMARYPQSTPFVADLAPFLTLTKWIFVSGSFLILMIGIVMAGYARMKDRRNPGDLDI